MTLITAFTWSGIDLMRFTRVSGEILDKALLTTSVNCSIDEGGDSSLLTFSMRVVHMFSMEDKSGELSLFHPPPLRFSMFRIPLLPSSFHCIRRLTPTALASSISTATNAHICFYHDAILHCGIFN